MLSPPQVDETELHNDGISVASPTRNCLYTAFTRVLHIWTSLQLSYHGGKCSIERALALDEYTRTTSFLRVVIVCIGTPLPMMILVILQELVPLQDPTGDWTANYGFWFRLAMLSVVTAHTYLVQGTFMVDGFALSWRQLVVSMLSLSLIHTGASMIVAANLAFPIPFFYITMTPSFYIPLFSLLYFLLGRHSKLTKCVSFIATQKVMGMIYPVYQLLFHKAAETHYVVPVVLLLPVIKLAIKNIVLRQTNHLKDLTPETVIFTVDFYHALYVSTCMETASTLSTMLTMISTDIAQTIMILFGTHRRSSTILLRLRQATGTGASENLLTALCVLCRSQRMVEMQMKEGVCVRSCLQYQLSPADETLIIRLNELIAGAQVGPRFCHCLVSKGALISSNAVPSKHLKSPSKRFSLLCLRRRLSSVHPMNIAEHRHSRSASVEINTSREELKFSPTEMSRHPNILREALAMLYTTECLVLTAYLEAFIPLFYGNYMMIVVYLPNAKYHTELIGVTRQNVSYTAQVIFLFGLLQLVSFFLLAMLILRICGMRILYHLSFVLETQMTLVQGKLMIWMLVTLACRVVHFGALNCWVDTCMSLFRFYDLLVFFLTFSTGVDYSFKFAWLGDK